MYPPIRPVGHLPPGGGRRSQLNFLNISYRNRRFYLRLLDNTDVIFNAVALFVTVLTAEFRVNVFVGRYIFLLNWDHLSDWDK